MSWKAVKEFLKPGLLKIIIFILIATTANLPFIGTYNPHPHSVSFIGRGVEHTWNFTLYEPNPLLYAPFVLPTAINCKLNQNCTRFLLPHYPLINQFLVVGESLKWYMIDPTFFKFRISLSGSIYFISMLLLYWYLLFSLIVFLLKRTKFR